jgi:ATP-dependent exoDNAse (exonuclease V) alpha subunit
MLHDKGMPIWISVRELDDLVLCSATTIHKSQGSEYPVGVLPLSTQHFMMLMRNLIYTGLTRGKRLAVLVGRGARSPSWSRANNSSAGGPSSRSG